jgi:hypothetical protein
MADIEDILAGAKLPERTVPLCMRGDLVAEFEDLERKLAAAQAADDGTLAGNTAAREIAEQIEALLVLMREHERIFRLRAIDAKAYSNLIAEHPPTDEQRQQGQDTNWDTYPAALIAACAIDPKMTVEQAEQLSVTIAYSQWDALFSAAYALNRRAVDVPFSATASAILAATAPSSKPPGRGASPGADSSAGSLAG